MGQASPTSINITNVKKLNKQNSTSPVYTPVPKIEVVDDENEELKDEFIMEVHEPKDYLKMVEKIIPSGETRSMSSLEHLKQMDTLEAFNNDQ